MDSNYLAAKQAIAMSGAVLFLICFVAGLVTFLGMWLLSRSPQKVTHIHGVPISQSDVEYFAGMWVAIRSDSYEVIGAHTDRDRLLEQVDTYGPECDFSVVRIRGVLRESLREIEKGGS